MNSRRAIVFTLIEVLVAIAFLELLRNALHATWQSAQ
jgi:type II secretory pathway component PulJ